MNLSTLISVLWPELVLVIAACLLFLLGVSNSFRVRGLVPVIAAAVLVGVFFSILFQAKRSDQAISPTLPQTSSDARMVRGASDLPIADSQNTLMVGNFAVYVKLITAGLGVLFVLLAWPTNREGTGNAAMDFASDGGEFFALMLLSLTGVFLVAGANDIMLLFLGIELASIPTYIMVSISRPLPIAQEAGVKYFFLGTMAAALMLFGFSYLYGTTGQTKLDKITEAITNTIGANRALATWQMMAVIMLLVGFAFKIAAVPLHAYAGDVYQGAATPVTAFLAYVPKTSGFIAIIKVLSVVSAALPETPRVVFDLVWIMAVLTMTFGNALAVTSQYNIKRVLAYSSVAHSGYMLVGIAAMLAGRDVHMASGGSVQESALMGVLFYLCAYGIMNTGAFGVLMMLPGRADTTGRIGPDGQTLPTAGSAETFDDIAGEGRRYPALGLAMLVCCLSLTGIPLTIGFFGKVLLIKPAWAAMANPGYSRMMGWLVVIMVINAAVSAAYYLRIVAYMFLRQEPADTAFGVARQTPRAYASVPVAVSIILSVIGTLYFGIILPATDRLTARAQQAAQLAPQTGGQVAAEARFFNRSGR